MANLSEAARQARIAAHRDTLKQKLAHRLIDTKVPAFADLIADKNPNKPMDSLNGEIILERDLAADGSLKGVVSVHPDALACMLPDIKADTQDKMGWKKHLDKFRAEGKDILVGVAQPSPTEYEVP